MRTHGKPSRSTHSTSTTLNTRTTHLPAIAQRGSFTAEAAAGLYMEERQAAAQCLMRLLAEVASRVISPHEPPRHPYTAVFHEFVVGLLAERQQGAAGAKGPQTLLMRLIDALKVWGVVGCKEWCGCASA